MNTIDKEHAMQSTRWLASKVLGLTEVYGHHLTTGEFTVWLYDVFVTSESAYARESTFKLWSPLTSLSDAWKVVMAITAVPKTGEEAERMWNTQFAVRFGRLALWAMDEAQAANAICQLALQISGYYEQR